MKKRLLSFLQLLDGETMLIGRMFDCCQVSWRKRNTACCQERVSSARQGLASDCCRVLGSRKGVLQIPEHICRTSPHQSAPASFALLQNRMLRVITFFFLFFLHIFCLKCILKRKILADLWDSPIALIACLSSQQWYVSRGYD